MAKGNVESDQPYSLQTSFTPTVDVGEPNDSFGSATLIEIGQAVKPIYCLSTTRIGMTL